MDEICYFYLGICPDKIQFMLFRARYSCKRHLILLDWFHLFEQTRPVFPWLYRVFKLEEIQGDIYLD